MQYMLICLHFCMFANCIIVDCWACATLLVIYVMFIGGLCQFICVLFRCWFVGVGLLFICGAIIIVGLASLLAMVILCFVGYWHLFMLLWTYILLITVPIYIPISYLQASPLPQSYTNLNYCIIPIFIHTTFTQTHHLHPTLIFALSFSTHAVSHH